MLKKAFRWLLYLLIVLVVLVLTTALGLYVYVQNNKDEAVREAVAQLGFDLNYKKASLTAWSTWPRVKLRMDSVSVRDTSRTYDEPKLLHAGQLDLDLNFSNIWEDTLKIESFHLTSGSINLLADTSGVLNLGAFAGAREETKSRVIENGHFSPVIDWEGVRISVTNFGARYLDSLKRKRFITHLDSVTTITRTLETGELQFLTDLHAKVEGLGFNTDKGSYLKHTSLRAGLKLTCRDTAWTLDSTLVTFGPDTYGIAATIGRKSKKGNFHISISNPAVDYERARALLHDELDNRMKAYAVDGPFPLTADIYGRPEDGNNVEVHLRFATKNQTVRLNTFQFSNVTTKGIFVNRLPRKEGGSNSSRDFRIETAPTVAYYDGMRIETPLAIVRGKDNEPFLDAPITLTGRANALARLFGNTNFLFTDGDFKMTTHVNASLMSVPAIISSSDGTLLMRDLDMDYKPAGIRFAFGSILVNKFRKDVTFGLESGDFPADLNFNLKGKIHNLLPLLLDRPGDSIRTEVQLTADRLDWVGFRQLFGQESFDGGSQPTDSDAQIQSMKRTLLGLRTSFHPSLEVQVGKMAYYDDIEINNLLTGLHFAGDTMVLEHTTFDWLDSQLALDGRFNMGVFSQTPFRVEAAADNLNLQALREPLTTFGLKLPKGIDSLPTDLRIRFAHRGIINDTFGVQPGHNVGQLEFSDGKQGLFSGQLDYHPVDGILHSTLGMEGDPAFVNQLFAAEDFFFSSGNFRIALNLVGIPTDLEELIESSVLNLQIDSTSLRYEPAGAYVPIECFQVSASENHATVDLQLTADATRKSVQLNGELDGLSAFLYPERSETFRVRADASAARLHASDVSTFVSFDEPSGVFNQEQAVDLPSGPTDTVPLFDPQQFLSAGEGIFNSFRPDLSLRIDTFDVDKTTQFRNLHTGIRMRDSTLLVLEKTGFEMDAGRIGLAGTYNIDRRLKSPFTLGWRTDSVLLDQVLLTAQELGLLTADSIGSITGVLATRGDLDGQLNEGVQQLLLNRSEAGIQVKTSTIVLDQWPQLKDAGKKMWMKKRFSTVYLAPLDVQLRIDSGRVHIPHTEVQSSALQFFIEGTLDTVRGPDLLISLPLKNIFRGVLDEAPAKTGFALAGRKAYLIIEPGKGGATKTTFRLGRRKYYKDRGRLEELRALKRAESVTRRVKLKQGLLN